MYSAQKHFYGEKSLFLIDNARYLQENTNEQKVTPTPENPDMNTCIEQIRDAKKTKQTQNVHKMWKVLFYVCQFCSCLWLLMCRQHRGCPMSMLMVISVKSNNSQQKVDHIANFMAVKSDMVGSSIAYSKVKATIYDLTFLTKIFSHHRGSTEFLNGFDLAVSKLPNDKSL